MGAEQSQFNEGKGRAMQRRSITRLDPSLRAFMENGVDYQIRIIVGGDIGVGKTCLASRLRGGGFLTENIKHPVGDAVVPTLAPWRSKTDQDARIMLEIWEYVRGRGKGKGNGTEGLKLEHDIGQCDDEDSENDSDIYRGASGVILMYNPAKKWTYEYCRSELSRIPSSLPVAILANFRDLPSGEEGGGQVPFGELQALCKAFSEEHHALVPIETSLLNCFGLKQLSTFLHIPYLLSKKKLVASILSSTEKNLAFAMEAGTKQGQSYEDFENKLEEQKAMQKAMQSESNVKATEGEAPQASPHPQNSSDDGGEAPGGAPLPERDLSLASALPVSIDVDDDNDFYGSDDGRGTAGASPVQSPARRSVPPSPARQNSSRPHIRYDDDDSD